MAYAEQDATHRDNMELVSVLWKQDQDGSDNWYHAALKPSFEKKAKIWDDRFDPNGKDRDHSKMYVGSFKHAMFLTRFTRLYGLDDLERRSNDWYFIPVRENEIIDGLTLRGETSSA
ncbi:MAG: hypothetical protein Q9207_008244, partial [Kuettlingeria erythrocarpa]